MNSNALKELQAPIKAKYREDPDAAVITLKAEGAIGEGVSCSVDTGRAIVEAGLIRPREAPAFKPVPAICSLRRSLLARVSR